MFCDNIYASIKMSQHNGMDSITTVTASQACTINKYKNLKHNTGHFIMFSVITNICNKKTKGPTLMELFTATGKLKKFFFDD
jgi:hypothetical protein